LIKFFLDRHGCAKNQVDGETLIAHLCAEGYERTEDASLADLIVINSCGFVESAKKESLDALFSARKTYPGAKIMLAGCLAERYADVFKDNLPEADGIFGNGNLSRVGDAAKRILDGQRVAESVKLTGKESSGDEDGFVFRDDLLSFPGSAYVKISEGCNNRCSFCAIPHIRGNLRSRAQEDILFEMENLLSRGIHEIILVGQDLASYGADFVSATTAFHLEKESPLERLISAISLLPGNFWLRLLYMHPDHISPGMFDLFNHDLRILPYFDIPFQSGSDSVLRAMNRKGTAAEYAQLTDTIRERINFRTPVIRTTFLAGFPGETEDDALRTEDFLRRIQPDWSGAFVYSREEDTPAYSMKNRVPKKIAAERKKRLEDIQAEITEKKLAAYTDSEQYVLVEEVFEDTDACYAIARTWFQAPDVDGTVVIPFDREDTNLVAAITPGALIKVRITGVRPPGLTAAPLI
jgi:ribosomal protein S12 methylthiotransferase